jgi:protein TonB
MTEGNKVLTGWARSRTALAGGSGADDGPHELGTGYGGSKGSPLGLGGTIAVHVLAVGLFLLVPREIHEPPLPPTLTGTNIPLDPPPPEPAPETPKTSVQPRIERPTAPDTIVKVPTGDTPMGLPDISISPPPGDGGMGTAPRFDPPPIPEPVLVEPRIDSRALRAFQPDYPAAMIRLGEEGKVRVRVTIGPDGRVTAIERLDASNDAFWAATERHARKAWRFRPATRDGVPVGGTKILTVYFKLDGL